MQVVILGATGTCKHAVAKELTTKDGFLLEPSVDLHSARMTARMQAFILCERWKVARDLTKRQEENDYLTIRSFWDTDVYIGALNDCRLITSDEYVTLTTFYLTMLKAVEPPHGVIYLHATEIQARDRQALKGAPTIDGELEEAVKRRYAEHVERIALPCAHVAVTDRFEEMMDEVRGAMDSLRSSNAGAPTIWRRSYFK
jgi:Deoxynucleoside kinase